MAQEIKAQVGLTCINGKLSYNKSTVTVVADQSLASYSGAVQSIGTTQSALSLNAGLTTAGWAYFCNLDATNYLQIGLYISSTFYPFAKLKAGEACVIRIDPAAVVYAKANTAACLLEFCILDD